MKLSQHTIFIPDFPTDGKYLVYNTFNQATAVISEQAKQVLTNLQNPVRDDEMKYMDKFAKLGFVVDDSVDESKEFRDWYNKARRDKSVMRATILTTYDCNFACEYCVEEGVKGQVKMDEDRCRDTVKWLINRAKKNQPESILMQFYGGEPLMNIPPIDYIASEISAYSKRNGASFSFNITTNASLLKPDLVERLVPLGLTAIRLTIDGDRDAHDSKRPFKSGKGSFDVIVENMIQVADKVKIRIGVNVDNENMESVPRMLDYLEQVGLKDKIDLIKFNPIVHIQGTSQSVRQADCAPASEEWMMDNLIPLTQDAYRRGFKTDNEMQPTVCSMNLDGTVAVIDPIGRIYTCPAFVGREGFQTGDIYHQELFSKHEEFMSMEPPDDCFRCAYMLICGGGCKHLAYTKYGDMTRNVCDKDYLQKVTAELLKMHVLSQRGIGGS